MWWVCGGCRVRGNQFIDAFDEIFRTERMKILKTTVRTPVAHAFAERWIGTLRREHVDDHGRVSGTHSDRPS